MAPSSVIDNLVHPESVADLAGKGHPVTDKDMPENPSLPMDVHSFEPQVDYSLDHVNPPAVDKEVREVLVDHMTDSILQEKPVKTTPMILRGTGETIHPLFIEWKTG